MKIIPIFTSLNGFQRLLAAVALCLSLSLCAQTTPTAKPAPVDYYRHCSYIDFAKVDEQELTREERIARHEQVLFDSLNTAQDCMQQAAESGAEKISQAGQQSGLGGAGGQQGGQSSGSAQQGSQGAGDGQQQQGQQGSQQTSDGGPQVDQGLPGQPHSGQSKAHSRGTPIRGSSALCDAVKQGLDGAQTKAEKHHFTRLMKEYGCN